MLKAVAVVVSMSVSRPHGNPTVPLVSQLTDHRQTRGCVPDLSAKQSPPCRPPVSSWLQFPFSSHCLKFHVLRCHCCTCAHRNADAETIYRATQVQTEKELTLYITYLSANTNTGLSAYTYNSGTYKNRTNSSIFLFFFRLQKNNNQILHFSYESREQHSF